MVRMPTKEEIAKAKVKVPRGEWGLEPISEIVFVPVDKIEMFYAKTIIGPNGLPLEPLEKGKGGENVDLTASNMRCIKGRKLSPRKKALGKIKDRQLLFECWMKRSPDEEPKYVITFMLGETAARGDEFELEENEISALIEIVDSHRRLDEVWNGIVYILKKAGKTLSYKREKKEENKEVEQIDYIVKEYLRKKENTHL